MQKRYLIFNIHAIQINFFKVKENTIFSIKTPKFYQHVTSNRLSAFKDANEKTMNKALFFLNDVHHVFA